jgi:hypothetical protein
VHVVAKEKILALVEIEPRFSSLMNLGNPAVR